MLGSDGVKNVKVIETNFSPRSFPHSERDGVTIDFRKGCKCSLPNLSNAMWLRNSSTTDIKVNESDFLSRLFIIFS